MSDKIREAFEAWHRSKFATKRCTGQPTRDMHNGVYDDEYGPQHQQQMWEAWQAAIAQQAAPAPAAVPDGYVLMPKALTAENGAKALLAGEFSIAHVEGCHGCDCTGGEDDEPCAYCGGTGEVVVRVSVDWPTIKAIYAKAVEHFAPGGPAAPEQAEQTECGCCGQAGPCDPDCDCAEPNAVKVPRDLLECYLKGGGDWVEAGHKLRALLGDGA